MTPNVTLLQDFHGCFDGIEWNSGFINLRKNSFVTLCCQFGERFKIRFAHNSQPFPQISIIAWLHCE